MPFPSKRDPELEATILARISAGEPLAKICREEGMPHTTTFSDWVTNDEALAIAYARAREVGFDALAAEALAIADDGSADYITRTRLDGSEYEALDAEHIQRSRLRVEARLKLLAKWDPKRYGDRIDHTSSDKSMSPGVAHFWGEPAPIEPDDE